MGSDMSNLKGITIFLSESIIERLIDYVVSISDPLLVLIRRAEELLIRQDKLEVPCVIYANELRRLADIQETLGNHSDEDNDLTFLLKLFIS